MKECQICFEVAYPPSGLSPNARSHWAAKNKLFQTYKGHVVQKVLESLGGREAKPSETYCKRTVVNVQYTVWPPDRRARDEDNFFSSMKAAQDAIAYALGIDDCHFHLKEIIHGDAPVKGGKVGVRVEWKETS